MALGLSFSLMNFRFLWGGGEGGDNNTFLVELLPALCERVFSMQLNGTE